MVRSVIPSARATRSRGRRWLHAFVVIAASSPSVGASLTVTAQLPDGQPLARAVITVLSPGLPPRPPARAVVDQINQTFVPDILVIPAGSMVEFPNSDTVAHQVYSFSPAKRFQLPLYSGNAYPPLRFEKPGLVVLGCNIHDAMIAHLVVTDAPLFGLTDESGQWNAAQLPPGTYAVRLWHPRVRDEMNALEQDIVLGRNEASQLTFRLKRRLQPMPIEGRSRSWDRY